MKQQKREEAKTAALVLHEKHPEYKYRQIHDETKVPIATISKLINGQTQIKSKPGKSLYFDDNEELELMNWIGQMVDHGFIVTKTDILNKATTMYQTKTKSSKTVSNGWYDDFRERHPELVKRACSHITQLRIQSQQPERISHFFTTLDTIIKQNNISPDRIYNCDETGINKDENGNHTLAIKGTTKVQCVVPNDRRLTTILACVNAIGESIPPLIIHKSNIVKEAYFACIPTKSVSTGSAKGFITKEIFLDWVKNHFNKYCGSVKPVLLILDNHSTHVDVDVVTKAKELDIIMVALPPHTSHLYQPLDVGVFSPLKHAYHLEMDVLHKTKGFQNITEADYTTALAHAYVISVIDTNIIGGFSGACIYPLNTLKALDKLKPVEEKSDSQKKKLPNIVISSLFLPKTVQH